MHDIHLLADGVAIFGVGLIAARIFKLLGAPSVIGYLIAGLIVGPFGMAWVQQEDVEALSEFGLILLLFIIGLELSPKLLMEMGKSLLTTALIQVGTTVAIASGLGFLVFDLDVKGSFILGVIVALSSTAIVLKQISDRGEANTPAGRMTTGILIIQDILVIVVMVCLPFFAFGGEGDWKEQIAPSLIGMGGLVVMLLFGRKVLSTFIKKVVYPGGPEFVAIFAVLAAFGGALLAGLVGWSLPLGACIVGLLLAESDARHQIASDVLPLRDVFNALFFISLGMLVDMQLAMEHALFLSIAIGATLLGKSLITAVAVKTARWPAATALQIGIGLGTVSEFGFVLAREANHLELLPSMVFTLITVYVLGTMFFGAMLVPVAQPLSRRIVHLFEKGTLTDGDVDNDKDKRHILICGYGTNGQNLARVLKATHIPFSIIEIDPRLCNTAREDGHPINMGDASRKVILQHAGLESSEGVVVAINDYEATARVITKVRSVRKEVYILADTPRVEHIDDLYKLGATEVLAQDFETSIELSAHILKRMDIPDNIIASQITVLRSGRYSMLRDMPIERQTSDELMRALQVTATRTHYIAADSIAVGATFRDLDLRAKTGASVIAVVRNGKPWTSPPADFKLAASDVLVLVGGHVQLEQATVLLDGKAGTDSE